MEPESNLGRKQVARIRYRPITSLGRVSDEESDEQLRKLCFVLDLICVHHTRYPGRFDQLGEVPEQSYWNKIWSVRFYPIKHPNKLWSVRFTRSNTRTNTLFFDGLAKTPDQIPFSLSFAIVIPRISADFLNVLEDWLIFPSSDTNCKSQIQCLGS